MHAWKVLLLLCSSAACHDSVGAAPRPVTHESVHARAVGCIGMTVADARRSAEFFVRVLAFRRASENKLSTETRVQLELGRECLELSEPASGLRRPIPRDSRSNDLWFQHIAIVVADMDKAYAHLEENHVARASASPQRLPDWNRAAAGIRAYYFLDPDRHTLEVIQFPPGKGLARWQSPGDGLFLGIDHTAIAVKDTEASLHFYRDTLGFAIVGGSENWGPEQEALNNVPGAHLRITTLRASQGPGIELLEYLAPRDGRPMPPDEQEGDATHWRTTIDADGPAGARMKRDPDGHVMEVHSP